MKKTLSILLAVLMLLATFTIGFAVLAEGDSTACPAGCGKPHSTVASSCSCCLNCPNLDLSKVAACAKDSNGVKKDGFCCANCTGFYDCTCGKNCNCKFCQGTGDSEETEMKPVIPEQTQVHIKELFQTIIHKISEVFDRIFEAAFAIFNVK